MALKDTFNRVRSRSWDICVNTSAEIYIGAAAMAVIAGTLSYQHEAAKLGQIPVAYSEIDQTIARVDHVPPLTMYYSVVNDVTMQVFEANNNAYLGGDGGDAQFARALKPAVASTAFADSLIASYAPDVPQYARSALASLSPITTAAANLKPVIAALDAAWDESHNHHYKNVTKTRRVCDSDNKCRTERYTDRVYDYTIHRFTYDEAQGALAARLLKDFMAAHPDVRIDETLLKVTETSPQNEEAMRESRENMPGYTEPAKADYLAFANTWATGSHYNALTPQIYSAHAGVMKAAPSWIAAEPSAESKRYRTRSRSHSGPSQFQAAEEALAQATTLVNGSDRLAAGIERAATDVPQLEQQIRDYIDVVLNGKDGNPRALRGEIMETARAIYDNNYGGGFDTAPAKWWMLALWGLAGALAGTGTGYGVDRLIDRKARYHRLNP